MAAHDLRSPHAAIKMMAYNICRRWRAGAEPSGTEWASVMDRICRAADEACDLIDDLLEVERLAADDGRPLAGPSIDIRSVIQEAIAQQNEILEHAGCEVTVARQERLERARGRWDRSYLLRVFGNLLRNSALHAPGAPIFVTLGRRGGRLRVVFRDCGPGLPSKSDAVAGARPKGLESRRSGHGFGLWIVRRAVERLNGRLFVRNTPGQGLAFDIELPGLET
jgi:signal transduction histidine kinase